MSLKALLITLFAVLLGAFGGYWLAQHPSAGETVSDVTAEPAAPADFRPVHVPGSELDRLLAPTSHKPVVQSPTSRPAGSSYSDETVLSLLELPSDFLQTHALYSLLLEADVPAIQRHISEALTIPVEAERNAALNIIFGRYGDIDPDGALAYLYDNLIPNRSVILYLLFNGWAKFDADAAIARLQKLPPGDGRSNAGRGVMNAYSDADFDTLSELARQLPESGAPAQMLLARLKQQAEHDPEGALSGVLSEVRDQRYRYQAIHSVGEIWAGQDAPGLLDYAREVPNRQLRDQLTGLAYQALGEQEGHAALLERLTNIDQPQEQTALIAAATHQMRQLSQENMLRSLDRIQSSNLREQATGYLVMQLANSDPGRAADLMLAMNRDGRTSVGLNHGRHGSPVQIQYGHQVVSGLAAQDPVRALEWAMEMEGRRGQLWSSAVHVIANEDPAQALALLKAVEPTPATMEAMTNVLGQATAVDPQLAVAFLDRLPSGPVRAQALQNVAQSWLQHDSNAAVSWVLGLEPGERDSVLQDIGWMVANENLALAQEILDQHVTDATARANWVGAIVNNMGRSNPQAAIDWVTQFEDEEQYGSWVGMLAGQLVRENPAKATLLVESQRDEMDRRVALDHLIRSWSDLDPEAAAAYLNRRQDRGEGMPGMQSVVYNWYRYDPEGAESWVLNQRHSNIRDEGLGFILEQRFLLEDDRLRLLNKMSSPDKRGQALQSMLYQYGRQDPDMFRDWIRRANLTPDLQAGLEQQLQQLANQSLPRHYD